MNSRNRRRLRRVTTATVLLVMGGLVPLFAPAAYHVAAAYLLKYAEIIAALALVAQAIIFVASLAYARGLYLETRASAARNNTLKLIFEEHTDRTVAEHRFMFRQVRESDDDRLRYYDTLKAHKEREYEKWKKNEPKDTPLLEDPDALKEQRWNEYWQKEEERWWKARVAIFAVMNRYEAFAIGIETGAIDEGMYRRWWKTTLVNDWHALRDLITWMQGNSPNAFIEFQALAERWQEEDTKERRLRG